MESHTLIQTRTGDQMARFTYRLGIFVVAFFAAASPAAAQLTINYTFDGFYDANRQGAVIRAGDYIRSQFDARGSITVNFDSQPMGGGGPLAFGGTSYLVQPGTFANGIVFMKATTNTQPFSPPEGDVTWNTSFTNWHTSSTLPVTSGQFDMQSVALHELSHTMGFASLIDENDGSGLQNNTPGLPDTYSQLDRFLRVGQAPNAPVLVNSNGTFNLSQQGELTGNNIYFHGEMAMAANGGLPVRMAGGGDLSHVHTSVTNAVMQPAIPTGVARRTYHNVELAMLIDMGWNQFIWKNNTGNWADNVSNLNSPRWVNVDNDDILSPVGTITPNLVLRFGGAGGYTSTNNLNLSSNADRFKVNRIILNATAGTSTIASNGSNILQFDTTIGITPLIRQDGAGAFNISHPIELTASNLQLGGNGNGNVNLSGPITGTGGLSKIGTSTFELSGATANSFSGTTTVSGGTLLLNKTPTADAIDQNLTIATGGTVVLGNNHQLQADGSGARKVTLSGGTLSTGAAAGFSDDVGAFEMTASSTIDLGTGDHELRFNGITGTPTGTLSVLDWAGVGGDFGTQGRVVFAGMGSNPNGDFASFLSTVQFEDFGTGATFLATPQGGVYELVPVPEPATILAIAFGSLAGVAAIRRRLKKSPVIGHHLSV